MEKLQHCLSDGIAQNSRDNNSRCGNGGVSAQLLRHPHANGCGNRLGQQGHILGMPNAKQGTQDKDAGHAGYHPGKDAAQQCTIILLQHIQPLIKRNSQANRGRCQELGQHACAGQVVFILHACQQQHPHGEHNGDQQGIQQGRAKAFFQCHACHISGQAECQPKEGRTTQELNHASLPPSAASAGSPCR